ncbi:hypothetical protein [Nodularia spumigena]|jgi:hypothetical protein|uniref:hypothetical protein n=1 Tax=Nodularia spumigena TaxID=70799 RepID=UPI002B1F2B30|nr:hypothetical protein [Nodularia spumigena]MEA5559510.1 hypothetical protein [Nodularia spumigena CH309]
MRFSTSAFLVAAVSATGCAATPQKTIPSDVALSPTTKSETRFIPLPPGRQSECLVRIFQGGTEIAPVVTDGAMTFKLSPQEFRLEVTPDACEPSIALQTKHELAYITQTPLIFGTGGYWVAGDSDTADILGVAAIGGNPRTTIEEEIESATSKVAWAKQQYQELCTSLTYCPTPVKHYATAWPFLDPITKKNRRFADFKRFDKFSTMSQASGRVLSAVVYTNWETIVGGTGWNQSFLYVLRPHVITFDFRQ